MLNLGASFSNCSVQKDRLTWSKTLTGVFREKPYGATEDVANDSKLPLLLSASNSMVGATRRNSH